MARVCAHVAGARRIADLFSGVGTIALRMAEFATVDSFNLKEAALSALAKAARVKGLRQVAVSPRDLFRRPLGPLESNDMTRSSSIRPARGPKSKLSF